MKHIKNNPNLQQPEQMAQDSDKDEKGKEQEKSQKSDDSIDYYADDTPLPKGTSMDLKKEWLSNTDQVLRKFSEKLEEIKNEREGIEEGFKIFAENQNKYKLSSLQKININLNKKQLYNQYLLKTRKTFEKLSPVLLLNIFSYATDHLFFFLTRTRRVSKIFNQIYLNSEIQNYLAIKDYLYEGPCELALKESKDVCKNYNIFHTTFLYYKNIQYTEQIPQNSIMQDFEKAVGFINRIHKLVHNKQNRDFTYYSLINKFMHKHRVVMGLSSLSLTSLLMVRKSAIIAFSNYLAFNRLERSKQQITKTKYLKVIAVVEYEDYRDSLVVNTKVSNYLWDVHRLNFAVLVTPNYSPKLIPVKSWNFLIFHLHDQLKTVYLTGIQLKQNSFQSARIDLKFSADMTSCIFSTIQYQLWIKMEGHMKTMVTLISPPQDEKEEESVSKQLEEYFSFCLFYRMEQYYIIATPHQLS